MQILLHKIDGRAAAHPVEVRPCLPDEAKSIFTLQNEVRAAMPNPELFVPDTLEHITAYLENGDLCLGAWDGETLGAFFLVRYCGRDPSNYAAFLGVPPAQWEQWANADSAVVCPSWRGNGLQRSLFEAALPLLRPGITAIGATVSPANAYSLRNALACGFSIACRREMYGGHDRYLLVRELRKEASS